jgi:putative phosphoribosyl transferase
MAMIFKNREEAGEKLAEKLAKIPLFAKAKKEDLIILGLPRGGVVTASVVAQKLGVANFSAIVANKIGYPANPEYAIGAIAEDGEPIWGAVATGYHLGEHTLEDMEERALKEISRRVQVFRQGRPLPKIKGKIVILIDDGIATGMTMRAAVMAVKKKKPKKIIIAVPVAPPEVVKDMKKIVNAIVTVSEPEDFSAVGQFYIDFLQVTDEEVIRLLSQAS